MIGPLTNNIINSCIEELQKEESRQKIIINVVNPITEALYRKYYIYIYLLYILLIIIVALLSYSIYLSMNKLSV